MKIYIGSDHGGFGLKEKLKKFLGELGQEVEDLGAHELIDGDDYPDFVIPVGEKVVENGTLGIVIGRSGNGEAIAANKVFGARAALCKSVEDAKLAREKNDANVLSLGADFVDLETAKNIVKTFLETPFSNAERHTRRIKKITDYEEKP